MSIRFYILALGTLLVGTAIGFCAGIGLATPPDFRKHVAVETPNEAPQPESRIATLADPKPVEPATKPVPVPDFRALLDAWYAEEKATPAFGTGEVRGRVVDQDGKGMPGIKVCCRWSSYVPDDSQPYLKDFDDDRDRFMEAVTRYHLRTLKRMDAATLEQVSAADGSVAFSRVPEKNAWLFIKDTEFRLAAPHGYQQVAVTPGKPIVLRIARLCEVDITAVAVEAAPGMKFELYISPFDGQDEQFKAEVGVKTVLKLPAGIYTVRLLSRGSSVTCLPVEFELKQGQGPLAVALNVEINPQIHGTVTFWGSTPTRADIVAVKLREGLSDDALLEPARLRDPRISSVGGKGEFWLPDLARGEYLVAVRAGGRILAKTHATASPNSPALVFSVSGPPADECLIINLYLPGGQSRDTPEFSWAGNQGTRIENLHVWVESPTRYRLWVGPPPTGSKEQEGTLTVTLQGYGTTSAATRTLHGEMQVNFLSALTARVLLKNVPEELKHEIYLTCDPAKRPEAGTYVEQRGFADRTLSFRAARLQPGTYVLTAKIRTLGDVADITWTREIAADMGPVELTLPDYSEIRFEAGERKPEEYAYVRAAGANRSRTVLFGSDGVALAPWMAAGKYTLHYGVANESKTFEFTVSGAQTFKLP